ncbi:PilZ domain-containing protein [Pseudoalteromonas sp. J010]|uniref:PilZ domain-containing protein n=1 Tax=Pseudoalteromonas sp. J010 TaxID=998465 RepID=UPI000F647A55|nr:PilZ domain-containing protein [Pseudoalteromonas sp. J010]RRS07082.1 PilZ domain-containing protein [Pseudoalteromonas sp. J010]
MINEDKRRFMRMSVDAVAQLRELESGKTHQGVCHDLSATGLSVTISDPVEANTVVDIFIDSSGDMIQPLSAHATVIRCSQEQDGQWIAGLEITKFN